jgi:hypothetical protein
LPEELCLEKAKKLVAVTIQDFEMCQRLGAATSMQHQLTKLRVEVPPLFATNSQTPALAQSLSAEAYPIEPP